MLGLGQHYSFSHTIDYSAYADGTVHLVACRYLARHPQSESQATAPRRVESLHVDRLTVTIYPQDPPYPSPWPYRSTLLTNRLSDTGISSPH